MSRRLSRREALRRSLLGVAGVAGAGVVGRASAESKESIVHAHVDANHVLTGGLPRESGIDPV